MVTMSSAVSMSLSNAVLLLLVVVTLLLSVSVHSQPQVMNFCYYLQQDAAVPAWTISASGSMTVVGPNMTGPLNTALYQVVAITGTRTQTGLNPSAVNITGVIPGNSVNGYDNMLNTVWPFLSGGTATCSATNGPQLCKGGLGYSVSSPVTVPNTTTSTSVINIVSHPINELPLFSVANPPSSQTVNGASNVTGLSYFVYIPASAGVPNCSPSAAVVYSFYYVVTPTYNAVNTTLYPNGDWSACASGNLTVLGPFPIPSLTGSGTNNVLVVINAAGSRIVVAQYGLPAGGITSNITGVGTEDGGDFMIYNQPAIVSWAGLTFRYPSEPPIIQQNGIYAATGYNYLNLFNDDYAIGNAYISEANVFSGIPFQVSFPYPTPYGTNPLFDNYQCPATILTQAFSFCYYGEGQGGPSNWTVSMYGTLYAAPELMGTGIWFVTGASGNRVQTGVNPSTVTITGISQGVTAGSNADNAISSEYPFLNGHGITFNLGGPVTLPYPGFGVPAVGVTSVTLVNDPPCELGTCGPSGGQYTQRWSVLMLQPYSQGAIPCGPPGTANGLKLTPINFGYLATPRTGPPLVSNHNGAQPPYFSTASAAPAGSSCSDGASILACPLWSTCVSATVQAVGPLSLPSPTSSNTVYAMAIYSANGSRVYADVTGATQRATITGVVYQDGGDQTLYVNPPSVNNAGISFSLTALPQLALPDEELGALTPGQPNLPYINLWSATQNGLTQTGVTATEATLSTYPDNTAQIYWGTTTSAPISGVTLPLMASAYTCPATVATTLLNFCIFISALPGSPLNGGYRAVSYSGQLYVQPAGLTSSSWLVTGITGNRTTYAVSQYGSGNAQPQPALSSQLLSSLNSAALTSSVDHVLSQTYPVLNAGIGVVVSDPTGVTPQQQIILSRTPPAESLESWSTVDIGYTVYTAASDNSLNTCPPTNTQVLQFYYTATPANALDDPNQSYNTNAVTGAKWSSCMSALVQVIGPYAMPRANGGTTSAYIVLGAAGARTFVDVNGSASTTYIAGLNNGVGGGSSGDGADQYLFTTAPYVDNAGITFDLIGSPQWPNSDPTDSQSLRQFDYINLWYQGFADWNGPTEAILPYTPYNYVNLTVSPYTQGAVVRTCPQGPNLNTVPLCFGFSTRVGPYTGPGACGGSTAVSSTGTNGGGSTATGTLCFLEYGLPGNVDYPWSAATSVSFTYNPSVVSTAFGSGVTLLSGTGTRTFTNRFGFSITTALSLAPAGTSPSNNVLYLNSAYPVDSSGISWYLNSSLQLPGQGPSSLVTQITVFNQSGVVVESGAGRIDGGGSAFLSSVPGFTTVSIGASNINALAVSYSTCTAPIIFTNGLRSPTQPSASNGALRFLFSYYVSDGATYSVQGNLTFTTASQFATLTDQLGNPYQTVVNVNGTRLYTHFASGQRVLSTVSGLNPSTRPSADQRFYPYSLLASSPGVYSVNTAPFFDFNGVAFGVSPSIPQNGVQPGVGTQFAATALYISTSQPTAVLTEGSPTTQPLVSLQQQTYLLQ